MTQEEKDLLFKDLCARLPYQPMCEFTDTEDDFCTATAALGYSLRGFIVGKILIKPYLRPMSSMTDKEKAELKFLTTKDLSEFAEHITNGHGLSHDGLYMFDKLRQLDFCLSHHFDFRGLIPMGLALEAKEGMYNN